MTHRLKHACPSVPMASLPMQTHCAPAAQPAQTITSQITSPPHVCSTAALCDLSGIKTPRQAQESVWLSVQERVTPTIPIRHVSIKTQSRSLPPAHRLTSQTESLDSASRHAPPADLQMETHATASPPVQAYTTQTPSCVYVRLPAREISSSMYSAPPATCVCSIAPHPSSLRTAL